MKRALALSLAVLVASATALPGIAGSGVALAAPAAPTGSAGAPPAAGAKPFKVTWLGHAAFEVASPGGTKLLIDPFLTPNGKTPPEFKDLSRYKPNAILVTHSHYDHTADAEEIARTSGAPVISAYEWVDGLNLPAAQKLGGNIGGTFTVGDVVVHLVPAVHSSAPSGRPMGFVLTFADGRSLYHTGDTWIFGDMALIQELYHPEVILLNVGGGYYGSDPKTAALAIRKYFTPKAIVPMHFATFPMLATEADVTAAFKGDARFVMMTPGQTREF